MGTYAELVLGRGRPQLHLQLRQRLGAGRPGAAHHRGLVGVDDLRECRPPASPRSYSGFVNGDTAASLTTAPTCSTTATSSSPVGSYPSTLLGGGRLQLHHHLRARRRRRRARPPLSITASSASMTYGGSVPTITASYSGFVNGDSAASLTTAADVLDHGHVVEPGGQLPELVLAERSTPTTPSSTWAVSVTVGTAPLSITASSGSMTYGGSVPTITPSYSGFVNGDSAASLTTAADVLDHGHVVEPGGQLPELVLGRRRPELRHHLRGRFGRGRPAPLSITASSASITYGDSVPAITASYSGFVNGDDASRRSPRHRRARPRPRRRARSGATRRSCSGAVDANYAISYVNGVGARSARRRWRSRPRRRRSPTAARRRRSRRRTRAS